MLIVVLAEPQGYKTIEDFAKLVYNLFKDGILVLLNPQGAAIQNGIPILSKIALAKGKSFAIISKFSELFQLFHNLQEIYIISEEKGEEIDLEKIEYKNKDIALIFTEHPSKEFTKDIKDKDVKYLKINTSGLTLSCQAAILLYKLYEKYERDNSL